MPETPECCPEVVAELVYAVQLADRGSSQRRLPPSDDDTLGEGILETHVGDGGDNSKVDLLLLVSKPVSGKPDPLRF